MAEQDKPELPEGYYQNRLQSFVYDLENDAHILTFKNLTDDEIKKIFAIILK
jgi:hypothetical protein